MLENNVFRFIMLIGSIIVVSFLINSLLVHFDDVKHVFNQYFLQRLTKY
ncbi:hypothetical protein NSQ61_19745 [Aeribacillus sp. FSL K6-1121]